MKPAEHFIQKDFTLILDESRMYRRVEKSHFGRCIPLKK